MASAEDYRDFAVQCMILAQNISDPADKARLISMAQAWRDLADRLDSDEKSSLGDSGNKP